jgi:hypothetical protein
MRRAATISSSIIFFAAIVNFIAFSVISSRIGGSAMNGYTHDGHYFVGSHGAYTEVSAETWQRNRLHGRSVGVSYVLAIGSFLLVQYGPTLYRRLRRGARGAGGTGA